LARDSPEPSTTCGCTPNSESCWRTTAAPAAVVPAPPNVAPSALSSISASKLSDGTFVRRARSRIGGESTPLTSPASTGVVPTPVGPSTRTPALRKALASRRAASCAGDPSREKPRATASPLSTPPMSRSNAKAVRGAPRRESKKLSSPSTEPATRTMPLCAAMAAASASICAWLSVGSPAPRRYRSPRRTPSSSTGAAARTCVRRLASGPKRTSAVEVV
jgi:hypothetical protein